MGNICLRRTVHKLLQLHKMVYETTLQYLSDLVPPFNQQTHHYTARQYLFIRPVLCKTKNYMNYFLPSFFKLWNALSNEIKQYPSISNLKHFLSTKSPRRKNPPYYLIGSQIEQSLHTRLLLNCSLLNAHLHPRNIVKSPNCLCGSTEATEHYFIYCPLYTDVRT